MSNGKAAALQAALKEADELHVHVADAGEWDFRPKVTSVDTSAGLVTVHDKASGVAYVVDVDHIVFWYEPAGVRGD